MKADLAIINGCLVIPGIGIVEGTVAIRRERIIGILDSTAHVQAEKEINARGLYVFPGVVQPHAHLGGEDGMEDLATETRSALVGGVTTTLIFHRAKGDYTNDFPTLLKKAAGLSHTDFSYHLQIMEDAQIDNIPSYLSRFGVSSFKLNMGYKGEEAKGKDIHELNDGLMYEAFKKIGGLKGVVACVHAENSEVIAYQTGRLKREGRDDLVTWSQSRPFYAEAEAVGRALYFSGLAHCPLYFAHTTTAAGLDLIREHRKKGGSPVFVETCPHYLTHHMGSPVGRLGRFIPPLRSEADNEALWQGLIKGDVHTIGIDQSTRKIEPEGVSIWVRKTSPREAVTTFPVLITEGFHKRGLTLPRIAELISANPAKIFNLYPKKGALQVGSDADVAIVDVNLTKKVETGLLYSASNFSIYEGSELTGWPVVTVSRGRVAMQDGEPLGERGWGKYVERGTS